MKYTLVGLGNPGDEYVHTRHNVGRMVVEEIRRRIDGTDWREDVKLRARIAHGVTAHGTNVVCMLPDNYMNRSGGSVAGYLKDVEELERLVVVHDDIDLPLGQVRIVYNRGPGGHNGVRSVERALRTRAFTRVRVGVVPVGPDAVARKPKGAAAVESFLLKQLSAHDRNQLQSSVERAADAVLAVVDTGRDDAMCVYNGAL